MFPIRVNSVLRAKSLKSFTWSALLSEIKLNAPILYQILLKCTKTKHPKCNRDGLIGTIVALLAKYRCPKMNLLHKIVALILYAGNSEKQVANPFLGSILVAL